MSRIVDRDLDALRDTGLRMASHAEAILAKAVDAMMQQDRTRAAEVAQDDVEIDRLDVEIDDLVLEILALQSPVARDLRAVIGVKSLATDLERVGDLARNIAKAALRLCDAPTVSIPPKLGDLADESRRLLRRALDAYAECDAEAARQVRAEDDEIDQHQDDIIREAVRTLRDQPETSSQAVDFILTAKNLERVADHATNIAEEVVRIEESRNLKHIEKLEA